MFNRTTAKRPQNPSSETDIAPKVAGAGAKALPAVSPVQKKMSQAKSNPVQKMGDEEKEPMQGKFDPVQKMEEEKDPVQGKFDPVQKMEEEKDPVQGKFDPVQKMEEEKEPVQGKFDPVQKMEEEKDPVQGRFDPVQKMGDEEKEPMQGKFEPVQKMEEEKEPVQGKFEPVQKMGDEEKEPMQGKFDPVQKMEEEKEPVQGKFDPVQKMEEEKEPVQGKFDPVQKMEEEKEPVQGKFDPVQKMEEEKDPVQGKFTNNSSVNLKKNDSPPVQLESGTGVFGATNKTGLSNNLKSGIENISGMSMNDVKVHYNSSKPAQLKAHAYAQGTDIHVAPGQEKHLPHEAWHVVQQKQNRVKPTIQMKKTGVPVNDDVALETEADVMGAQALAKGNEMGGSVQKKEVAQLRPTAIDGSASPEAAAEEKDKSGIFGAGYAGVKESVPELAPGMAIAEKGTELSGKAAKAGLGASWDVAAAPARWAGEKMAGTDSKAKKFGYGAAGALGSVVSGAAGAVGAGLSVAGGLAGAAVSGGVGLGVSALGGLWKGAKAAGGAIASGAKTVGKAAWSGMKWIGRSAKEIPGAIKGAISGKKKSELASLALLGAGGASTGAAALTGHFTGAKAPTARNIGHTGPGAASEAMGGLGAAAGILGTGASLAGAYAAGEVMMDKSMGTHKTVAAGAEMLSNIAAGTKSAASAAYNIASLVDAKGAAAAGSFIAASGASIAMGAIDIIRGGYGVWAADQRAELLKGIMEKTSDTKVKNMAMAAVAKQGADMGASIGTIAKGVLAVAGGAAMIIAAASPVGWVLLGLAAAAGLISLLVNKVRAKESKKKVVMELLGVTDAKNAYDKKVKDAEDSTTIWTDARKEKMKGLEPDKDPLTMELKKKQVSIDVIYNVHINDTVDMLYDQGVLAEDPQYVEILNSAGLKLNKKDPKDPQPSKAKIKKAIAL